MNSAQALVTLPDEILERVLVACAENAHTESVAAIAATSRHLHAIVYRAADHHLWRSLFLAVFDDPRHLRYRTTWGDNWKDALQARLLASHFVSKSEQTIIRVNQKRALRSESGAVSYSVDPPRAALVPAYLRMLRTITSVILTAAMDARSPSVSPKPPAQPRSAPSNLIQLHTETEMWPPGVPLAVHPSLNVAWLETVLANGLPGALTAKVSFDNTDEHWHATPEGLATSQVIAHTGFLPICSVAPDLCRSLPGGRPFVGPMRLPDLEESSQRDRARQRARLHVYNMDYLSSGRNWGPYLEVLPNRGATPVAQDDQDPNDNAPLPRAEELRPDWSWLAAARVVAECRLRAAEQDRGVKRLIAWDNLREGAWAPPGGTEEMEDYDWAGAQGVWRRLVCWLDYHDLVRLTMYGESDQFTLNEEWVIVPLSLRITGYSPSSIVAYADRPTIHVEGEMGGAHWRGDVDFAQEDIRRVHGSVSMLADGSVRWCITSMNEDNTVDQWASEAIQLGGVGSAMGSLGMWTGARHEEDDPLGVIWQWRVK